MTAGYGPAHAASTHRLNMIPTVRLDEVRRQQFADAVEAAVLVRSRQQFFVWSQSAVQALLPHQILICGVRCAHQPRLALQHFSACRYFRQSHLDQLADPLAGLVPHLAAAFSSWHEGVVTVGPPGLEGNPAQRALHTLVVDNELQNLVVRLVTGSRGQIDALYAFARVTVALDDTLRHAVQVLTPHLHEAFVRVLQHENERRGAPEARTTSVVTLRQQEILGLIKAGKTNAEIATVLACSPWTVKNHIQSILRRLECSTRAHALARAMSLGILRPD